MLKNNSTLCTVALSAPAAIGSVTIAEPGNMSLGDTAQQTQMQMKMLADLETQKQTLQQTCQVMEAAASQLSQTCQDLFDDHKDQIAKLAVEIARTVLMQKVFEGAYDIEAIVKEALRHAPTQNDVTIRVNPLDLADCCAAQAGDSKETLGHLQFVADPDVGRADCVLESPKGIIQSMIDEHLHRIGEALKKTE